MVFFISKLNQKYSSNLGKNVSILQTMIRITHHREKCIGCNYCIEVAPSRWEMNKTDGKCNLLGASEKKGIYITITGNDEYDESIEAAQVCPINIIKVEKI